MRGYTALINEGYYNKLFSIYEKSDQPTMYDDTITIDKNYYDKLKKENTWISVKDKLPTDVTDKIVCDELGHVFSAYYSYSTSIPGIMVWYYAFTAEPRKYEITHWRPLPNPPESEE